MVIAQEKSKWELLLPKKHLKKNTTLDKQAKHWTQEETGKVLCLDLDIKKIGPEVFGEFWNVVLEKKGEDKIIREINYWTSSWTYKREENTSK